MEWNKTSYIIPQKGKQGALKVVSHQGQDKTARLARKGGWICLWCFNYDFLWSVAIVHRTFQTVPVFDFFLWLSHFCHDLCQRKSRHKNLLHKGDDLIINPGTGASHVTAQVCLSSYLYLRENLLALAGSYKSELFGTGMCYLFTGSVVPSLHRSLGILSVCCLVS